jgi:Tfp pilus assembly protein PilO
MIRESSIWIHLLAIFRGAPRWVLILPIAVMLICTPHSAIAAAPSEAVLLGQIQAAKNELSLVKSALQLRDTSASELQRLRNRQAELERSIEKLKAQLSVSNR